MKANDLLDMIGDIDESIIAEAKSFERPAFIKKILVACIYIMLITAIGTTVYAFAPNLFRNNIKRHQTEDRLKDTLYSFDIENITSVQLIIFTENNETAVNVLIESKEEFSEESQSQMKELVAKELNIDSANVYLICIISEETKN